MSKVGRYVFAVVFVIGALVSHAQAQEESQACLHANRWKPTDDDLKKTMKAHQQWAEEWKSNNFSGEWDGQHLQGRANLCNADLAGAELNKVNLSWAKLNKARLSGAKLNEANLLRAKLNETDLDE